jgi:hypothetical protein
VRLIDDAIQFARLSFGKADDGVATRLWLGDGPETIYEKDQAAVHIYLGRDSNWLQIVYSGAHEAFHRACSPCIGSNFWVDEMLAVDFSLQYLRAVGLGSHADLNEISLRSSAARRSVREVVSGQLDWLDGGYGRAFLICEELTVALGRSTVATLPSYCRLGGEPAFLPWRDSLSLEDRQKLDAIIGTPEGASTSTITPTELAAQIWGDPQTDSRGVGARQIRLLARELFPSAAPGQGGGWHLTTDQADAIRQRVDRKAT